MEQQREEHCRWLPLEANPDVLNPYLEALGGPTHLCEATQKPEPLLQFEDLLSLEPWAFDMLECSETVALLLVFPLNTQLSESQVILPEMQKQLQNQIDTSVWFTKQTIPNACGTIALLHCIANLDITRYPLQKDGILEKLLLSVMHDRATYPNALQALRLDLSDLLLLFVEVTKDRSPSERAQYLESDKALCQTHQLYQEAGATDSLSAAETDMHFTCLIPWRGFVLELDGRKPSPTLRGKIDGSFAEAATRIIAEQLSDPRSGDIRLSLIAVGDRRSVRKQ